MAEGGTDPELDEMVERFRKFRASDDPDQIQETTFTDDNTQYNTGNNLVDTSTFEPPRTIDPELQKKEFRYIENEQKLENAIKNTDWRYTKEGLQRLSSKIYVEGGNLYYLPEGIDIYGKLSSSKKDLFLEKGLLKLFKNKHGEIKAYGLRLNKDSGKFYSELTISKKYGVKFTKEVADTLFSSEEILTETEPQHMGSEPSRTQPQQIEMASMDNEPSRIQPQQITSETQTGIIERIDQASNTNKLVKSLIDASDEELEILGFTEQQTRELKGMLDFINNALLIQSDKDIKIGELEIQKEELKKKLADLQSDYAQLGVNDTVEREELIKQIKRLEKEKSELIEEIKVERDKLWEIYNEKESQISRMKNLITDVLKNPESEIPLKDRIKLLFKIEGLTVGAIIAAIVMTFATLGLSISNSLKGSTPPSPSPPDKPNTPSIPNKVKEGLKKFAEWLKELAKKSLSALPGIIGSIVSFIFKSAGAAVGFLAEHLIILIIIIVSSIVYGMMRGVSYIKNKR